MITSLAYIGITSPSVDEWARVATDILGCELGAAGPDGALRLRFDDALWRIQIHPGAHDEASYFGWTVAREEDLVALTARLADAGTVAEVGSPQLAAERSVDQLIGFDDPWGFRHEVVWAQHFRPHTFRPARPISGFVTGDQGLGHVVLLLPDVEKGHEFFSGVLGFRLSDKIINERLNTRFYHCNGRHHSLAIGQAPGAVGFNHLMVEVASLDDVGTAYDRCAELGVPLTISLGRHTNDMMTSFYLRTPSQFHIEYGWGGLQVDDATWVPKLYRDMSTWGHHFSPEAAQRPPGLMRPAPGFSGAGSR